MGAFCAGGEEKRVARLWGPPGGGFSVDPAGSNLAGCRRSVHRFRTICRHNIRFRNGHHPNVPWAAGVKISLVVVAILATRDYPDIAFQRVFLLSSEIFWKRVRDKCD